MNSNHLSLTKNTQRGMPPEMVFEILPRPCLCFLVLFGPRCRHIFSFHLEHSEVVGCSFGEAKPLLFGAFK